MHLNDVSMNINDVAMKFRDVSMTVNVNAMTGNVNTMHLNDVSMPFINTAYQSVLIFTFSPQYKTAFSACKAIRLSSHILKTTMCG